VDARLERALGPVTLSAEAGVARYDARGIVDPDAFDGVTGTATLAARWPAPGGIGELQLALRGQELEASAGSWRRRVDAALGYSVSGTAFRLAVEGAAERASGGATALSALVGVQVLW